MLSGFFHADKLRKWNAWECKTPSGCSPITSHYITLRYTTLRYIALHDTSAWHSFSSGWAQGAPPAKKCTGLVICTFCRSAQLRPNAPFRSDMAATSAPIHTGPVLGPTSAPTPDPVAHVKPKLRPNLPKLQHVGPQLGSSWAEVGAKVGPKLAPVRPNIRPRTAKFDPILLLVGPTRPTSSSLSCGRHSSRSDSNKPDSAFSGPCKKTNNASKLYKSHKALPKSFCHCTSTCCSHRCK